LCGQTGTILVVDSPDVCLLRAQADGDSDTKPTLIKNRRASGAGADESDRSGGIFEAKSRSLSVQICRDLFLVSFHPSKSYYSVRIEVDTIL
jgi:hypothetical protein